jgi:4'-phosphopantetheinyl transferase
MALALPPTQPNAPLWPRVPDELKLGPAEVHVLMASVALPGQRLRDLADTLSPDELERAARFHFHRDRERFIARRGLLRELLALQLRTAPARLVFSAGPFGKPALATPPGARPLHFSLAHSNDLAVFAMSREAAVGVDVEWVRGLPDLASLVSTVCAGRERLQWQSLPESQRLRAFFDVWTRKEAFLKGIGQGLQKRPQEIEVPLCRCEPDQALPVFDGGRQVPDWSLRSFSARDFALALALRRPPTRVCCWDWSSESQQPRFPQGG